MNADQSVLNDLGLPTSAEQIIWQTDSPIFSFQGDRNISVINNVVMNIKKPGPAEYLGFGEQGGRTLLKQPTFMNYFCARPVVFSITNFDSFSEQVTTTTTTTRSMDKEPWILKSLCMPYWITRVSNWLGTDS